VALIEYTAKRALIPGHVEGSRYVVEFEVTSAVAQVVRVAKLARSFGGGKATDFERSDTQWDIAFAPVCGQAAAQLDEFLESIETGELWRIWLQDADAIPLSLKCGDQNYSKTPFVRLGAADTDHWVATVYGIEAVPYDPTGNALDQSYGGDVLPPTDEITIDVFPPDGGPGDMDPPPPAWLSSPGPTGNLSAHYSDGREYGAPQFFVTTTEPSGVLYIVVGPAIGMIGITAEQITSGLLSDDSPAVFAGTAGISSTTGIVNSDLLQQDTTYSFAMVQASGVDSGIVKGTFTTKQVNLGPYTISCGLSGSGYRGYLVGDIGSVVSQAGSTLNHAFGNTASLSFGVEEDIAMEFVMQRYSSVTFTGIGTFTLPDLFDNSAAAMLFDPSGSQWANGSTQTITFNP
jgi:hypothetical protein